MSKRVNNSIKWLKSSDIMAMDCTILAVLWCYQVKFTKSLLKFNFVLVNLTEKSNRLPGLILLNLAKNKHNVLNSVKI